MCLWQTSCWKRYDSLSIDVFPSLVDFKMSFKTIVSSIIAIGAIPLASSNPVQNGSQQKCTQTQVAILYVHSLYIYFSSLLLLLLETDIPLLSGAGTAGITAAVSHNHHRPKFGFCEIWPWSHAMLANVEQQFHPRLYNPWIQFGNWRSYEAYEFWHRHKREATRRGARGKLGMRALLVSLCISRHDSESTNTNRIDFSYRFKALVRMEGLKIRSGNWYAFSNPSS